VQPKFEIQRRDLAQEESCRDLAAASQCQLNRLQALKAGLQQQSRGWWGSAFWSFQPDPQSLFHASVIPLSVLFKTLTALSRLVHLSDLQTSAAERHTPAFCSSRNDTLSSCTLDHTGLPGCPWRSNHDVSGRATMPVSIEELDATVRAFYEGRGEQVTLVRDSRRRNTSTDDRPLRIAKSCPSRTQPGTSRDHRLSRNTPPLPTNCVLQFKEDPDAWLMVDDILSRATYEQTKCSSPARLGWSGSRAYKY